ncbi:MAG: DNA polymerase III subunit delta' [Anaerolineales bacterium]
MRANNWNMIGHDWAVNLLKQHVSHGIQRQAYLITGPESVGRRTLAIRFAQAVNCVQSTGDGVPCLDCPTCGQIERLVHPDLSVVEAERAGGPLKVDQIRELQHGLHLTPYDGNYRIALLLRFEEANAQASNALLKTLEEPPANVILLITAESAERLLPTIVSRCEVIRLRPVPSATLNQGLQSHWLIPPDDANLLTHLSGGRPGYSFRLYQSPEILSQRSEWLDDLNNLLLANRVARFDYADKSSKSRKNLPPLLKTWLGFWRDVMLRSINSSSQIINIDFQESIDQLAQDLDKNLIFRIVITFDEIFDLLDHNVNPRLAIEDLMLVLPFNP